MPQATVVIVGAGASGLSAAAALQRRGIDPVVLDQDSALGGTWARRQPVRTGAAPAKG
jgi:putative flavoprotein involved in K+ transport